MCLRLKEAFRGAPQRSALELPHRRRSNGSIGGVGQAISVPDREAGIVARRRIEAHSEEILALIDKKADITLGEIAEHLEEVHGLRVAQSTVWRLLDRHGMTFKKNRARQRTTQG